MSETPRGLGVTFSVGWRSDAYCCICTWFVDYMYCWSIDKNTGNVVYEVCFKQCYRGIDAGNCQCVWVRSQNNDA